DFRKDSGNTDANDNARDFISDVPNPRNTISPLTPNANYSSPTLGNSWTWTIHVANTGAADAIFADGQRILLDNLPTTNIIYAPTVTFTNQTNLSGAGKLQGSIASGNLTITATGGSVILGANTGAFDVSITATPTVAGTFANPRSDGSAMVDPDNHVS